ncbi:hypothetical protein LMG26690_00346 [Achromobacter animicus]|uniref:Uncharacterized protein n=1 Tax=Achromobacter animicus TaxID=1389935 RepID=A0A6S6Z483_9BURK|nr:hypothetical protein [Achromobacter animicus]CAB3656802.1 hypothetical protein LMG26690_00346 [Achromobacter animicus]
MTLPIVAHAQARPATVTDSSPNRLAPLGGDFELVGEPGSTLHRLTFRGKPYRPLNAYKFAHVRALGPTQGGQPILLAVSNDFIGVGTILIAVQNDTPLARVLSPSVDSRDPDMGLAQPGRQDVLLFTAGSRALVTSTGKVLWFEHLQPKERLQSTPLLVSVSPDNRHGAVLLDNEIRLSVADEGPYARVAFTKAMQRDAFKSAWDQSAARARKALDEGKHIDQRRLYDNLKAEWINRNFRWQEGKGGWQFVGQGLKPAPLPVQPRKEQ